MIPLKMRRLFFGFTPRRLLGINGSILAHCPSLNQNKFARICWPPIRLTNPLNLNMVNWVLTLAKSRTHNTRWGDKTWLYKAPHDSASATNAVYLLVQLPLPILLFAII